MLAVFVSCLSFVLFGQESTACSESITVESIELALFGTTLTCDLSRYVGTYYFYGFDDTTGYPRYVQPSTNGEFSLGYGYAAGSYLALQFTGTNIDVADEDKSDGDSSRLFSSLTWSSPANYEVTQEYSYLYYIDNKFFNYPTSSDYDWFYTNYYPIRLKIRQDLCDSHGLAYQPSGREEREEEECPNYDRTVYYDCSGDTNCENCQPWGCAQCKNGYYKMGNLMRCQSCGDNYPNCAQCGDWNGCISCNYGYSLEWSSECQDETCQ